MGRKGELTALVLLWRGTLLVDMVGIVFCEGEGDINTAAIREYCPDTLAAKMPGGRSVEWGAHATLHVQPASSRPSSIKAFEKYD